MPQLHDVKDMHTLALESVCKYVIEVADHIKNDLTGSRKYFIDNVHATARTDILGYTHKILDSGKMNEESKTEFYVYRCCALSARESRKNNFKKWMEILKAMLDTGVNVLPCLRIHDLMDEEILELVSVLNKYNKHLLNLSVEFVNLFEHDFGPSLLSKSVDTIQMSLENNLCSKLSKLVLNYVCNDAILKVIGENALNLKHLDITKSSRVNDMGIRWLLLKKNTFIETLNKSEKKYCKILSKYYNDKEKLNACCFTLEELLIAETKAEYASMLTMMACIIPLNYTSANLFLNKNLSDAIVSVWKNSPKPRVFQLTEIHDGTLTVDKLTVFGECLPHVKRVLTNFSSLIIPPIQKSKFWDRVVILDIQHRSNLNFVEFFKFMSLYGHNLLQLTIEDEEYEIDVAELLKRCPNLETLKARLEIFEPPVGQFTKLKSFHLVYPNRETVKWIFENSPCLEEAKLFTDGKLKLEQYIVQTPPLILCNSIKLLEITNLGCRNMNSEKVIQFIDKCSKLHELGSLYTWNIHDGSFDQIRAHLREKNYDLEIY